MSEESKGSINEVDSFSEQEKNELIEKNYVAVDEIAKKKGSKGKTEVDMGTINGIKIFTIGINESANWLEGIIRTTKKLSQQACVNEEIVLQLSPEQKLYLTDSINNLIPKLNNLLFQLNRT